MIGPSAPIVSGAAVVPAAVFVRSTCSTSVALRRLTVARCVRFAGAGAVAGGGGGQGVFGIAVGAVVGSLLLGAGGGKAAPHDDQQHHDDLLPPGAETPSSTSSVSGLTTSVGLDWLRMAMMPSITAFCVARLTWTFRYRSRGR
mgnify:CR=1 FL=1